MSVHLELEVHKYRAVPEPDAIANQHMDGEPDISIQSERLLTDATDLAVITVETNKQRFRVLYEERITYSWNNINVWTGWKKLPENSEDRVGQKGGFFKTQKKQILKNVSGVVHPGELVAILGASGAGKTTLLDILSFRNSRSLRVSGERAINGVLVESDTITAVSAYVQQIDLFFGVLTVREHLQFQALVRMHNHISRKDRMRRVEQVIQEFQLTECADSQIGTKWFKGISNGEMKRLSIATEILTDSVFMCCDEPTSGLDSNTAQTVMSILKVLASRGKTVICTVHQPSSQLFTLFDKVLLMSEGRVAFLGTPSEALTFFSTCGFVCPSLFNPADFFIDTLAITNGAASKKTVQEICDAFELSSVEFEQNMFVDKSNSGNFNARSNPKRKSPYKANYCNQFWAVLHRSWITYIRDPMVLKIRIVQTVILALFIGTIFYQLNMNSFVGIQNLSGAIFMILCCLTYQNVIGSLDSFCSELPVFLREHFNGMYRTDIYFMSRILIEIPFFVLLSVLFTGIFYYMVGFYPDAMCFVKTFLIVILVTNICSGVGYFISCLASTVTVALVLLPLIIFPFFLFSGFLLRPGTGPVFLSWIEYISWFIYGYEAIAIVQLENIQNIHCNLMNTTCPKTGLDVLETLGFDKCLRYCTIKAGEGVTETQQDIWRKRRWILFSSFATYLIFYLQNNFLYDTIILGVLGLGFQTIAFLSLLARTYRS